MSSSIKLDNHLLGMKSSLVQVAKSGRGERVNRKGVLRRSRDYIQEGEHERGKGFVACLELIPGVSA